MRALTRHCRRWALVGLLALLAPRPAGAETRAVETVAPGLEHLVVRRGRPASGSSFRVLLGSFERQARADTTFRRLRAAGVPVAVFYRAGQYHLAVDGLADRETAERTAAELAPLVAPDVPLVQRYGHDGTSPTGPWEIHVLVADPSRIRVDVVHAHDAALGLATTTEMARRRGALAAVNGGYYREGGPFRGDAAGVLVVDGRLLSEPDRRRGAVGFFEEAGRTRALFDRLDFEGRVVVDGVGAFALDGINRRRGADEIVAYGPELGPRTPPDESGGVAAVVDGGRLVAIRAPAGGVPIPEEGFVLSFGPGRAEAAAALEEGRRVALDWRLVPLLGGRDDAWARADDVLGGGPLLLFRGRRLDEPEAESISRVFYYARHPRTAVASRADGTLLFVTVDGRQPERSVGMSLPELTSLLVELGAQDALNLDGGGSTATVVRGRLASSPSDPTGERANADAILLFAREDGSDRSR